MDRAVQRAHHDGFHLESALVVVIGALIARS
jgi:hypothetical protein